MSLFDLPTPATDLARRLLDAPDRAGRELAKAGFRDPDRALRNLEGLVVPSESLPSHLFQELVETSDPDRALNNFERLFRAVFSPAAFSRMLEDRPQVCGLLLRILGGSQFMADILIRDPEYFYWLTESSHRLSWACTREDLTAAFGAGIAAVETLDGRLNAVRRLVRRELLRIGADDLVGERPIYEVADELSNLADVCLQALLDLFVPEQNARYGPPRNRDGSRAEFAIIGLGKLGGRSSTSVPTST